MPDLQQTLKLAASKLEYVKSAEERREKIFKLTSEKRKQLEQIIEAIEGLKKTKQKSKEKDFYAGKYGTAYWYVKSISKHKKGDDEVYDIEKNGFKPGLMHKCDKCGSKVPVLMRFDKYEDWGWSFRENFGL